jgi:transposase
MYVSTTKRERNGKVYTNYLIRYSYREGGKVKHGTIANISHLPPDIIETIKHRLKSGKPLSGNGFSVIRSLPHGHVKTILQIIKSTGLDQVIASKPYYERNIILALIANGIINPGSKLASFKNLQEQTATTSLNQTLQLEDMSKDDVYKALDWLAKRQEHIEQKLAKKHLDEGTIVLYDISGSYYTGKESDLVKYGYNRDGKKGHPQIVYGLLCNKDGCPVSVEVFPGNTADSSTLSDQLKKVRERFGISRVVWVGDRGMITSKTINEELGHTEGLEWITALRSQQVKKLVNKGSIQLSLFDEQNLAEIDSSDYPGERLVVCKNPLLADERKRNRQELLNATCKELDKVVRAVNRKTKPLRGKDEIGIRVGEVINQYKVGKHISYRIEEDAFSYEIDQDSIAREETLDGLYVIRTSLSQEASSAEETVETYKSLSQVEWAFRTLKTTRLELRPIYHWTEQRIKAHVFLCMLTYYVEWHLQQRLQPYLYADHEKEKGKQKRETPVSPAKKSNEALEKAQTHLTKDGKTTHSMNTVLDFLGTICQHEIKYENHEKSIYTKTEPTAEQKNILDSLGVTL